MNDKSKLPFETRSALYFLTALSVVVAIMVVTAMMFREPKKVTRVAKKAAVVEPVTAVKPAFVPASVAESPKAKQLVMTDSIDREVTGVDLRDCASVRTGDMGSVTRGATRVSRKNGAITVHFKGCAKMVWSPPAAPTTVASIEGGAK